MARDQATYDDLMESLESGKLSPVYLLYGEEDFLVEEATRAGYEQLFALTLRESFFNRLGFRTGLIADVQSWVANPAANFGWIILGDEAVPQSARVYASAENQTSILWPLLTVTYTVPARTEDWRAY